MQKLEIAFDGPRGPLCNPSVASGPDGSLWCIVREVNYNIRPDGSYEMRDSDRVIRTRNWLAELDPETLVSAPQISEGGMIQVVPKSATNLNVTYAGQTYPSDIQGFEDLRLFWWPKNAVGGKEKGWYALATSREHNRGWYAQQCLLKINSPSIIYKKHFEQRPGHQKNWMPFLEGPDLRILYSTFPVTEVLDGQGTTLSKFEATGAPETTFFRGGSQGVALDDDGWLFAVHEVEIVNGQRTYFNRFLLLNRDYRLVDVGKRFKLSDNPIEFLCGMARIPGRNTGEDAKVGSIGENLVLSYGVHDASAMLAILPVSEVLDVGDTAH